MRFAIALLIVCVPGAGEAPERGHRVTGLLDKGEARRAGDDFEWQRYGPLAFVEHLKTRLGHETIPVYTVWGYHRDWIRASDLPALRELLTSTEPCAALQSPLLFVEVEMSRDRMTQLARRATS